MNAVVQRISVRAVVEMTLHESDLSSAACSPRRMQEGAAAHRARQERAKELAYQKEVALSADYKGEALLLHVTGRADGIFVRADGMYVIEEIKLGSGNQPLIPAHRAQAAMYGHMLCTRDALAGACLRVLYVNTDGETLACYEEERAANELHDEFDALCAPVVAWEARKLFRRQERDVSLSDLPFPFNEYRDGQKRFASNVYIAIRDRKRLFAQAPTGIGKTMAALYPALRAMGEGLCTRVVFLTARTTGRRSAMDAMALLERTGTCTMTVEITAKDKICPRETRDCRPEICPLAEGFYDRLPNALNEGLIMRRLDRAEIERLAVKHRICPFELSLCLAQLADVVVCDYNYVFDPMVAMEQLLSVSAGACLLVDEAHQLAPRVRDAYSAEIGIDRLKEIRREAGKMMGRKSALYRALTKAVRTLEEIAGSEDFEAMKQPPEELSFALKDVGNVAGEALSMGQGGAAGDAFSLAMGYLFAAERFDERYALIASGGEKHAKIELVLLTAAQEIETCTKRTRGTIYFSATLAPFDAAKKMLGSGEGDACLMLPSPFHPEQLDVQIEPLDIRYASREQTAPQVAEAIAERLKVHTGNTIVFFPSYAYMARIGEILMGMDGMMEECFLKEARGMREEERNTLLAQFGGSKERVVLLAVLGGAFSEGIDLPGERLKNVIVVSTGLPQPDERVRAMQAYYDGIGEDGFLLAMTLPGMVRVIQAAGRLIRTETDTGTLFLIDSRYRWPSVRRLFDGTLIGDALKS